MNQWNKERMDENKCIYNETNIFQIPEAVFEYILSHLTTYDDLFNCKLVSKKWYEFVTSTLNKKRRDFKRSLKSQSLEWTEYRCSEAPMISARYSHNVCMYGHNMYVFGGCTAANTTFNDLWTFDLGSMEWVRPLVTGQYPPPKACASFIQYKSKLLLYGGWTHSPTLSVHPDPNSMKLFNQLHEYNPKINRWTIVKQNNEGPSVAAHSALIYSDQMIIFGGLTLDANSSSIRKSNELWFLDLNTLEWTQKSTPNPKPNPRYGHSMVSIGENVENSSQNFLLLGGCGGANMKFNDVWLLTIIDDDCSWKTINVFPSDPITSPEFGFNPVLMVEDMIVLVSKTNNRTVESFKDAPILRRPIQRPIQTSPPSSAASTSRLQAQPSPSQRRNELLNNDLFKKPSIRPNARFDREKQLENLNKMENQLKKLKSCSISPSSSIKSKTSQINLSYVNSTSNFMGIYVFDSSKVFTDGMICLNESMIRNRGPDEMMLYSIVSFHSEIIIFGGIQSLKSNGSDTVLNSILVATPQRTII